MTQLTRRRLLETIAACGAASMLPASATASTPVKDRHVDPTLKLMDEFVPRHMAEYSLPGMTLGLATRENESLIRVYGLSDMRLKTPVRPEHLFQIGSISKSFVAIILLALYDEGKLDLHRPIMDYLPWLRIKSDFAPITTHHLLSHSSGLANGGQAVPRDGEPGLEPGYAPGKRYYYSNMGFVILGHLIELLEQRDVTESLQARIFKPLGMHASLPMIGNQARTRMVGSYRPLYDDRPHPHGGALRDAGFINFDNCSGSILSTPADMTRYMTMLMRRGQGPSARILSEAAFALLIHPHILESPTQPAIAYGYGIGLVLTGGRLVLGHTGGMQSFGSSMRIDMDAGVAAFASGNHAINAYRPNPVTKLAVDAMRATRERTPAPAMPAPFDIFAVPKAADYAGIYTSLNGRPRLEVVADGGRLFLAHQGKRVPVQTSGAAFLALHPDFSMYPLTFGRRGDAASPVVEVGYGPDLYVRSDAQVPLKLLPTEWRPYLGRFRVAVKWETFHRVYERNGTLYFNGEALRMVGPGVFTMAAVPDSPERIHFLDIVNGKALRMRVSGEESLRIREG